MRAELRRARQRSREQRLAGAQDDGCNWGPDRLARERSIGATTVDVEDAWVARDRAHARSRQPSTQLHKPSPSCSPTG